MSNQEMTMTCTNVRHKSSDYLDSRMPLDELPDFETHLEQCATCHAEVEYERRLNGSLSRLPAVMVPAKLTANLRAIASSERSRVAQTTRIRWQDHVQLALRNLMRPLAVPAMGGFVSAIVLFSAIMPGISLQLRHVSDDVPTLLFTDASTKLLAPIGFGETGEAELVLDVVVDSDGRTVDYTVVSGAELLTNDASLKRQIENNLLFGEFNPATLLGGRTSGRVRLQFNHINIRG